MPERKEPKYFRCECGKLLTDNMIKKGICAGHKLRYATTVSIWEWLKVKTGVIK